MTSAANNILCFRTTINQTRQKRAIAWASQTGLLLAYYNSRNRVDRSELVIFVYNNGGDTIVWVILHCPLINYNYTEIIFTQHGWTLSDLFIRYVQLGKIGTSLCLNKSQNVVASQESVTGFNTLKCSVLNCNIYLSYKLVRVTIFHMYLLEVWLVELDGFENLLEHNSLLLIWIKSHYLNLIISCKSQKISQQHLKCSTYIIPLPPRLRPPHSLRDALPLSRNVSLASGLTQAKSPSAREGPTNSSPVLRGLQSGMLELGSSSCRSSW